MYYGGDYKNHVLITVYVCCYKLGKWGCEVFCGNYLSNCVQLQTPNIFLPVQMQLWNWQFIRVFVLGNDIMRGKIPGQNKMTVWWQKICHGIYRNRRYLGSRKYQKSMKIPSDKLEMLKRISRNLPRLECIFPIYGEPGHLSALIHLPPFSN